MYAKVPCIFIVSQYINWPKSTESPKCSLHNSSPVRTLIAKVSCVPLVCLFETSIPATMTGFPHLPSYASPVSKLY
ncbi:hypothetical protein ES703_64042 [subsurface metagenome]